MITDDLMYFNGVGGFSKDGKEYIIRVTSEERTPVPWAHIIANEKMGTLVTSNGGGFSWYGNSRENKLSVWSNDTVLDTPSERIILNDDENEWSSYSDKILEEDEFRVIYGFGYAKYKLLSKRYEQETTIFMTEKPYQKVCMMRLKNLYNAKRKIDIKFMIDAVLGVSKEYTEKHLVYQYEDGKLKIYNKYNNDYSEYFLNISVIQTDGEIIKKCEEDKFVGISFETEFDVGEEKEFVFLLDYRKEDNKDTNYQNIGYYKEAFEKVKIDWKNKLEKVQVTTPVDSMNIILNGWIVYQTLVSRLWGRASFYQSGGAYGFRDQLQDMLAILYFDPKMVKKQILYHAEHQFEEGDVLHWWHPERNNGIRTKFSDDLLWLIYLTCEYVDFTGDFEILSEDVKFISGRELKENEDEIYIETKDSGKSASLISHCVRAINRSIEFGEHGLPKMGSGDWNDGMNTVGGESVWLGFFLADILKKFLTIVKDEKFENIILKEQNLEEYKNIENFKKIKEDYEIKLLELKKSLDDSWDGRWFKRAYFKDGEALGSNQNDECKIDNISQSWAVISGMAKKEKQQMAMESVENYLVDHENMLIKLLTPPFCNTKLEPGYIKSYIPGVRENGGQYTHGAIWAIIANCILNKNEVATEYFRMLNPIEHTRTKEDVIKYKSEPYVIAADIYSHPNLVGRGGWSWYTGSASWYYIASVKYILGLKRQGKYLEISPKLPQNWENCYISYNIENTCYVIKIEKVSNLPIDKKYIIFVDNEIINDEKIKLSLDGKTHTIDIRI